MVAPFRSWCTIGLSIAMLALAGCESYFHTRQRTHASSSVVSYLYPNETNPIPPTDVPTLRLPLRVGVMFVPAGIKGQRYYQGEITEVKKQELLERVAKEFRGRDYIESIEIVPASYLRPGGGFDNLDQISRLLRFDVVALVAYDQVQFTSDNLLALTYWTIVGHYIFRGNKNDTQTLMEAAVYDIPSRHLLFRAPGVNQTTAGSTGVYMSENLRNDGAKSLDVATDDLIKNLKTQLESFRERMKQAPAGSVARIEHKPGYKGGGSMGALFASACVLLLGAAAWSRRR